MELKKLTVHNYKSLVNFELIEPNAFTVFAGPNGAGKSNIFEAVEFVSYFFLFPLADIDNIFGGIETNRNFKLNQLQNLFLLSFESHAMRLEYYDSTYDEGLMDETGYRSIGFINADEIYRLTKAAGREKHDYVIKPQNKFLKNFLRLFIKKSELNRIKYTSNERLLPDASNLESVLKRILKEEAVKEEFLEWLDLFIPGFSNIEIHSDNIGGTDTLLIYEEGTQKPFTKNLISDGTYNILALLTAVYQTNEPQFLCIEEPENGLNPYVVESLVDFFRRQCEEKGHVIWLNTHSQTLVKYLRPEELVLVEKKKGETIIKQFPSDYNLHGFKMDEAWLSNMLGGGLPW